VRVEESVGKLLVDDQDTSFPFADGFLLPNFCVPMDVEGVLLAGARPSRVTFPVGSSRGDL